MTNHTEARTITDKGNANYIKYTPVSDWIHDTTQDWEV